MYTVVHIGYKLNLNPLLEVHEYIINAFHTLIDESEISIGLYMHTAQQEAIL